MKRVLLLLLTATVACRPNGLEVNPAPTPESHVAVDFAKDLAAGEASRAHALLSSKLQAELTPEALTAKYKGMVGPDAKAPTTIDVMTTLETWPDRLPGDAKWVYVAIAGDGYSEGISVVVSQEASRLAIRSIEWGRP